MSDTLLAAVHCTTPEFDQFRGLVRLSSGLESCSIVIPHGAPVSSASVSCEPALAQLLQGKRNHIQRLLQQSTDVQSFFQELEHLARAVETECPSQVPS